MGTASLVLGILASLFAFSPDRFSVCFVVSILSLIFALIGMSRARNGIASNMGMAVAGLLLSVVSLIVAFSVVDSSSDDAPASAGDTDTVQTADDIDKAEAKKKFAGQLEDDAVGNAGDSLNVGDVSLTAAKIRAKERYGNTYLCSHVSIVNKSDKRIDYSAVDWSLQAPSGDIETNGYSITFDDALQDGEIAPGGTAKGAVCFHKQRKTSGAFVLLYEGNSIFDSGRAAWINKL